MKCTFRCYTRRVLLNIRYKGSRRCTSYVKIGIEDSLTRGVERVRGCIYTSYGNINFLVRRMMKIGARGANDFLLKLTRIISRPLRKGTYTLDCTRGVPDAKCYNATNVCSTRNIGKGL